MALLSASGVTKGVVCSLGRPEEAEGLTDPEKVALHYADLLSTDQLAVEDAVFDRLRRYFDEPQSVELGVHLATFIGFGRLSATWDIVDDLPVRFHRRSQPVTPWAPKRMSPWPSSADTSHVIRRADNGQLFALLLSVFGNHGSRQDPCERRETNPAVDQQETGEAG